MPSKLATQVRSSPVPTSGARVDGKFAQRVIAWQRRHGRHDLPWQRNRDAYAVWVSEIMLQQTQVATVIPYFERFMASFPDVHSLARADADEVLRHWSGLGYYSRARNLHAAARLLVSRFGAMFPRDPQIIATLPGIGRSTAAAIAALSFGVPGAILDGNVKRVLCRVFGIEGDPGSSATLHQLWSLAERLVPAREVEAYTQGVMDLGATVCLRRAPKCDICPVQAACVARSQGRIGELPRARVRRPRPERSVAMLVLHHAARVLLQKRPPAGIWGGLWCFPEAELDDDPAAVCMQRFGARGVQIASLPTLEHGFTHFRLRIHPVRVEIAELSAQAAEPGTVWLALDEARTAAIPTPVRKLLESA
ncbi:MAG: A/G-specific adenine glycosylase [Burkholderiales bacterium]